MRIEIDPNPPTLETFFHARHYSDQDGEISQAEQNERIRRFEEQNGVHLPDLLRSLYQRQNGGHTSYQFVPAHAEPDHVFEGFNPYPEFERSWLTAFPDNDLYPLEQVRTIGWFSDQIDFAGEARLWRRRVPDADQLLVLNSHGSEFFLCLDYRQDRDVPKVVKLASNFECDEFDVDFTYESFDAFFYATRREHE